MSMFMHLFSPPLTSLSTPRLTIIFSIFCCGFFARDDDVDVDVDDKYSLFCYLAMCARQSPSQAKVKQRSCSRAKTTSLLCLCLSRSLLLRLRFKVSVRLALQLRRRPWQWFWCRCVAATARWSLPVLVCHSSCCCFCFCAAALDTNGGWHSGQRGNGCMCVCACPSVSFVKHFWHSLVAASVNLICFSCLTQPPTVTATLALTVTAASVRDVGIKKRCCVGVFALRWVKGRQSVRKTMCKKALRLPFYVTGVRSALWHYVTHTHVELFMCLCT